MLRETAVVARKSRSGPRTINAADALRAHIQSSPHPPLLWPRSPRAGAATVAAFAPQSQLFGRTLVAGNNPAEAALTFDDGPNDRYTLELLDVLARYHARATFFMVGRHVRARPELVRAVAAAGHLIGNHTETHPWLTFKPAAVVREELTSCKHALEDILGQPVRYFRPPHGARRPAVLRIAAELGMTTVQWNAMAQDWRDIGAMDMLGNAWRGINAARRSGRGREHPAARRRRPLHGRGPEQDAANDR